MKNKYCLVEVFDEGLSVYYLVHIHQIDDYKKACSLLYNFREFFPTKYFKIIKVMEL